MTRVDASRAGAMMRAALRGDMRFLIFTLSLVLGTCAAHAANDSEYPTSARADYVFGCMKVNGETQKALEQCSCSIDVIASIIPYNKFVEAETVASMNQAVGQIGAMFRETNQAKDILADLRRAQAEAEIRCF